MSRLPDSSYSKSSDSSGQIIGLHQVTVGTFCEKTALVPFGTLQVFTSVTLDGTGVVISTNIQTVTGWSFVNSGKITVFVKVYDQTTVPNPVTDIPLLVIGVGPGNTESLALPYGLDFVRGLAIRATNQPAFNDTSVIAANTLAVNLFYTQ